LDAPLNFAGPWFGGIFSVEENKGQGVSCDDLGALFLAKIHRGGEQRERKGFGRTTAGLRGLKNAGGGTCVGMGPVQLDKEGSRPLGKGFGAQLSEKDRRA